MPRPLLLSEPLRGDASRRARATKSAGALIGRLRKHLIPASAQDRAPITQGVFVDALLQLDDRSFLIDGWVRQGNARISRLCAVSPDGEEIDLTDEIFRYARPDVVEVDRSNGGDGRGAFGFGTVLAPAGVPLSPWGWRVDLHTSNGSRISAEARHVVQEPSSVRQAIEARTDLEPLDEGNARFDHAFPALRRLQSYVASTAKVGSELQLGVAPESPDLSVIVPLAEPLEHLELQLASFADDPEIRDVDLIYVVDAPDEEGYVLDEAPGLSQTYGIAFRVAVLEDKAGFAGARVAGARLARGRLLTFLHSDVIPEAPGWLGKMKAFYDQMPNIGALGPKLLFEDDTVQCAGLTFLRPLGSPHWRVEHRHSGLHRNLEAANKVGKEPALGGACLMIGRDTYRDRETRGGGYLQPSYENADLCLQLTTQGLDNWYLPTVCLYHLAAPLAPPSHSLADAYDPWALTGSWGNRLEDSRASGFVG